MRWHSRWASFIKSSPRFARLAWFIAGFCFLVVPARAQDPASLAEAHLYRGTLAQGEAELAALVARQANDATAPFALGSLQFVRAVERLAHSFHRHGLQAPRSVFVPILRLPVPPNPHPDPLSYERFREILQQFAGDLQRAEATLARVGDAEVKLRIDLAQIRLDLNGDGVIGTDEQLGSILAGLDPRARGTASTTLVVAFDTGDAYWLRGYSHLLMATAEFWLAHDFRRMFEESFQLFFPRVQRASSPAAAPVAPGPAPNDFATIADAITFIHLLNWDVVETDRLVRAHAHLKAVTSLSRQSWGAILRESDDENEWIPSPRQTNRFPGLPVSQERVDACLRVMDEFEAVLDGRKLVPHWRLQNGFNFRRALIEHRNFDLVLSITGPGVRPFAEDGPSISAASWNEITRTFQGNFLGYAVWFN
jgi:hypothetical protein